jgi:hypothetical protein
MFLSKPKPFRKIAGKVNFGKLPLRTAADYCLRHRLNKLEMCKLQQLFLTDFTKKLSNAHGHSSAIIIVVPKT